MAKNEKEQGVDQMKAFKKKLENLKLNYTSLVSKSQTFSTNSLSRIVFIGEGESSAQSKIGKGY